MGMYFLCGILWVICVNVASFMEARANDGISCCEESLQKRNADIDLTKKKDQILVAISVGVHLLFWPITMPLYIKIVYFPKNK